MGITMNFLTLTDNLYNYPMQIEIIKATIEARYKSKRAFIIAFNQKAGFEALDETALSRQLSERVALSNGWKAAYKLFFDSLNVEACV